MSKSDQNKKGLERTKNRILGLDLGAKCGFGVLDRNGKRICSGTVILGSRSGESLDYYEKMIERLLLDYCIDYVAYEHVKSHKGILAAHAYGGYEAILLKVCYSYDIPVNRIAVQAIKKMSTGKGNGYKEDIMLSAMKRWDYIPEDDNDSDALWCAECVRRNL